MTNSVAENNGAERQRPPTVTRMGLCLAIMILGLSLRRFGLSFGLPGLFVKYGGSVLWATMLFFLVAITASNLPRRHIAPISAVIAIGVELFRLVHFPWLDSFRLTLAGALLLGRIFSPWDLLAYGVGIISGTLLDRFGSRGFPQ
jgi:Protein of unknown function (DUF2809)